MSDPSFQLCVRCVMDTSDPLITFDDQGICSHCRRFDAEIKPVWKPAGDPKAAEAMAKTIRDSGRGKEYDCIIGMSGEVDSSYVAHWAKQWDLRPLAVHVDGG